MTNREIAAELAGWLAGLARLGPGDDVGLLAAQMATRIAELDPGRSVTDVAPYHFPAIRLTGERICLREGCTNTLPEGSPTQRKFCTKRCQVAEWRRLNAQPSSGSTGTVTSDATA